MFYSSKEINYNINKNKMIHNASKLKLFFLIQILILNYKAQNIYNCYLHFTRYNKIESLNFSERLKCPFFFWIPDVSILLLLLLLLVSFIYFATMIYLVFYGGRM